MPPPDAPHRRREARPVAGRPAGADAPPDGRADPSRPGAIDSGRTEAVDPAGVDPAKALLAQARTDARAGGRDAARRRRATRGGQPTRSGSGPDDRDPQPFDTAVARLLAEHGWEVDVAVHAVMARWAHLVGTDVAAHCTPESFAAGELTVRTDSTTWATQIRLLAPQLVKRLNTELGDGTVRFVQVKGPDAPRWTHGQRSVRGRGPRDTYG